MLPNLLVIGAQKSGTTSLHRLLESHRDVYVPPRPQEIHYFDLEENHRRGTGWYETHFAGWSGQPWCAQTSPLYLYEPAAAGRIHDLLPEVRLVAILRDPVERAYSHYWHEVRFGFEELSFEEALEQEEERLARGFEARRHYSYLDRGRYAAQVERFLRLFDRRQLLLLLTDDLKGSQDGLRRQLADFLGVPLSGFGQAPRGGFHFNRTGVPRSLALQRLRRRLRDWTPLALAIDRINLRPGGYPPMAPGLRRQLQGRMVGELDALEDLSGLDLGVWRRRWQRGGA